MRTALLFTLLAACKWTEFDDLSNEAPAHSTTKPDVKSSDWAVAIAGAQSTGDGTNVVVMGTDPPTFSTIVHDASGNTSLGQNAINLNTEFAISSIPDPPILLDDPNSDQVALVIPTLDGRILVEGGPANMPKQLGVIGNDAAPLAATYALPTGATMSNVAVVGKGVANGSMTTANLHLIDVAANTQTTCTINDDNVMVTPLNAMAMAEAPTLNMIVVWTADGKLLAYDRDAMFAAGACTNASPAIVPLTVPGWGNVNSIATGQISIVGDHFAVLAGHGDPAKGDMGNVLVFDLDTGTSASSPVTETGLRGFALGQLGDKTYIALGFPGNNATPSDGGAAVQGGPVEVREIDPVTGNIGATIALQLSDAQPESGEKFGRAVAITDFGGMPILVVAASNELFSYYRTSLYDIGLK
jgi:hypothetical protein